MGASQHQIDYVCGAAERFTECETFELMLDENGQENINMIRREYNSFGFCCGLGGGAKGFKKAVARVGNMSATWRCIGGIDNDPAAARDFEQLVGTSCTVMDGLSDSAWRERIGNAVPPDAAQAIAEVMGTTLLLAESGETFQLSSTPVWVRPIAIALTLPADAS